VWHGEASLRVRARRADETPLEGRFGHPAYTPAVRRWVCIVAFLLGFSGDGYVWTVRPRIPVPVERLLDPDRHDPALPEAAWWQTS
jgi:hypothetical protein